MAQTQADTDLKEPIEVSIVGKKIREFRIEKGLTISELAEAIGVSPSAVSQFERGIAEPALRTVRACAEALDTPLFSFFMDFQQDGIVVRKNQRRSMAYPACEAKFELLIPHLNRKIEMLMMYLEPGITSSEQLLTHGGDECLVVLEGTAEVLFNSQHFLLSEGDSIYINAHVAHRVVNSGESRLVCVVAITPASF